MAQGRREILNLAQGQDVIDIEITRHGKGDPLILLYDEEARVLETSLVDHLAARHEVIVLSPPGFGQSDRPSWIETPDDLSYIMLDTLEALNIGPAPLLGFSLGGWLAAEMASKTCAPFSQVILVDPYGIKPGGPLDRDIADIWFLPEARIKALKYADPAHGEIDYTAFSDEVLTVIARNRESFARFCWNPYLHNPKLQKRLHRITVPTLVLWGEKDGIVTTEYGKAFAAAIPGARFETIADAGHYPHIDQPRALAEAIEGFIGENLATA